MENFENLDEAFVSREEIFSGRILHLVKDTVSLPDGTLANREICIHSGGVAVIPLLSDGRVITERQFRYAHGRVFREIPAGKLESSDSDARRAAERELREETGAVAGKYTYLGRIASTPALINEVIHLYLAEDITFGERKLDEGEFLNVTSEPLSELYQMALSGEIEDAKTQIAILKVAALRPEYLKKEN